MKNPIEKHLMKAIEQAPIHLLENLKNQPIQKMTAHDYITRQEKSKNQKKWPIPAFAFAAIFIGFFILWILPMYSVEGTLYLDINPSIEIRYNKREKVLSMDTLQPQDQELIQDISFRNKDIYTLMEEMMDILPRKEEAAKRQPALLVSVQNNDTQKAQSQSEKLNALIHEYLREQRIQQVVLSQSIATSHTLENFARQYNISIGKMTFIRNLIILNPSLTMEELVPLSIDDLVRLSVETGLNLKDILQIEEDPEPLYREESQKNQSVEPKPPSSEREEESSSQGKNKETPSGEKEENAQTKKRLTKEQAGRIALERAEGRITDIELDREDGRWVYEIDIRGGGKEYDILLDAYSGSILKFEVDEDDD